MMTFSKISVFFILLAASLPAIAMPATATDSLTLPMLKGEKWWGAATELGPAMPFDADTKMTVDLQTQNFNNQTSPLLVSNLGRVVWADGPMKLRFDSDTLFMSTPRGGIEVLEASDDPTLRGAYLLASDSFFKPEGGIPPEIFFTAPTYNTWIELMYDQNQADILNYARAVVDNGFKPGVLMIDDNWNQDYGVFEFRPDRFPNPKAMVDELHSLGFKVMLWVCPFVSPDSREARDLRAKGYLVKNAAGSDMALIRWWNGHSAVYDLSNPEAYAHLKSQLTLLQERYGIDGFKFDAGDPASYPGQLIKVFDGSSVDTEQTRLWARLAGEFPFNELRACWQMGNRQLVQRLGDKTYSWNGVASLVPSMIAAGLLGHSYACPDMIGGGEFHSFLNIDPAQFNQEIIVRSCQIHSMMPMMQFSVAPWRILSDDNLEICRRYARLHEEMAPYILEMAHETTRSGKPIVRHMAFEFPGQGFEEINDQYMLGDRWLVAPVMTPDNSRSVKLPDGLWRDDTGKVLKGGRTYRLIDVALDRLPRYERLSD